jgi:uncharacterized protein (TIGR02145 family)
MKRVKYIIKTLIVMAILLLTKDTIAQVPNKVSYQSIIRNSSGELVKSSLIRVKISILQGSASGTVIYYETHTTNSNENGMITLTVGTGVTYVNNFPTIDWSKGPYFLKAEIDPSGGTNYSITGTSEINSVPYALRAKNVENETQGLNDVLSISNNADNKQIKNLASPLDSQDATTKDYSDNEIKQLSYPLLLSESIDITSIYNMGYTLKELLSLGISVKKLLIAGASVSDLFKEGITISELFNLGVGVGTMMQAGKTLAEMKAAGLSGEMQDKAGATYPWVKIGNQIWMARNLAWLPSVYPPSTTSSDYIGPSSGFLGYYVYDYSGTDVNTAKASNNYKTYGVLYNNRAAETVCPTGWHLPTDTDWTKLTTSVELTNRYPLLVNSLTKKLKANSSLWANNNGGTDDFGFSALPGGEIFYPVVDGFFTFCQLGVFSQWWGQSTNYKIDGNNSSVYKPGYDLWYGFSVRCVKD